MGYCQRRVTIPTDMSTLLEREQKSLEGKQQRDAQALFVIQQVMADTTKKAWDILEEEFSGTDKVCSIKLQYLR